jgi:uncharacterized Tic20 family protein
METEINKDARMWGMLCHLGALSGLIGVPFGNIIVPLIIWLIKKDEHPFVDAQGRESLNFQVSMTIYGIVAFLLVFVLIGWLLLPVVYFANLICTILAAIKANDGLSFRYPATIRFF